MPQPSFFRAVFARRKELRYRPFSATSILQGTTTYAYAHAPRALDRSVFLFQRELLRKTHDPLWAFQYRLRYPRQLDWGNHIDLLSETGVSYEEYCRWKPVVYASNIDNALPIFEGMGMLSASFTRGAPLDNIEKTGLIQPPSWLVIYLVTHKVRTATQASHSLMYLIHSHFSAAPTHLQPSILILTALTLATFDVLNPMRNIIQTFLAIPLPDPWLYFNLLLLAISRFPRSPEVADLVVVVLEAMRSRQISLRSHTYEVLLADRFVTVQLTKVLRAQMLHEGFTPKASHLEAYLRVFAKDGAIHDAGRYLNAIRAQQLENNSDDSPHTPKSSSESQAVHPANTLYLSAFNDRASAFQYLGRLLQGEKVKPPLAARSLPVLRVHRAFAAYRRKRSQRRLFGFHRRYKKQTVDIYDWTMALTVATRDKTTTAEQLLRLLQRARSSTAAFRPTVATYTVVLRGLLYRKNMKAAEAIWHQLRQSGLHLDDKALTVGLQVLTRAGKPHLAFLLLELISVKPKAAMIYAGKAPTHRSRYQRGHVRVSTVTINEFMVSLMRIGRPDIVFKLWDYMETLYDVKPDAVTLNVMLKSAHLAAKLDDSLRGVWAELASKNPFRKHCPEPYEREQAVASITTIIGDLDTGLKPYVSGQWKHTPAWCRARAVFRQILLSSRPDLGRVRSPANAIRSSRNTAALSPMTELARGLSAPWSSGVYKDTLTLIPPSPLYIRSASQHPQIILNDRSFFAYIQLLGLYNQATEIPLALAWMRELEIKPSSGTLAIALIFWGEVSLHAPLLESWAGGRARSEYEKLTDWIRDWVGEAGVPKEDHIGHWLKIVQQLRESQRPEW